MIHALVTAVGCNTSLSIIKGLRRAGERYRIVGVDITPPHEALGASFCDAFYQVPSFRDDGYVESLLDIIHKEGVMLLFSVLDQELEILAAVETSLSAEGVRLCAAPGPVIKLCNDKYALNTFLQKEDWSVPVTLLAEEAVRADSMTFPVFIKPRYGVSSRDCYTAHNKQELEVFLSRVNNPLVQEFLEGDHYVIDVVNDLQARNIVSIPRREISAKAGIGVKAVTVKDEELIAYGRDLSELLGVRGAANIEVFRREDRIVLLEVNPRFSAGSILSVESGVNIIDVTARVFLGQGPKFDGLSWKGGVYMSRYWEEVFTQLEQGQE